MLARIVIIEDDVYMREELIDMLKKAGYDAVPLPAFENAVSQLAELSPDLILLDINLPFRSGFEIIFPYLKKPDFLSCIPGTTAMLYLIKKDLCSF